MSQRNRRLLFLVLAGHDVEIGPPCLVLSGAIGVARRRRLIARRRLDQRLAWRLGRELLGLALVVRHHAPQTAGETELGGAERRVTVSAGLDGVVARALGSGCSANLHLGGRQRPACLPVLCRLDGLFPLGDGLLATPLVRVLRPVRRVLGFSAGGRRQVELGRYHQRRSLAVFDTLLLHALGADAGHQIVDELLFEGHIVIVLAVVTGAGGA